MASALRQRIETDRKFGEDLEEGGEVSLDARNEIVVDDEEYSFKCDPKDYLWDGIFSKRDS
jgi:hypothetical protein